MGQRGALAETDSNHGKVSGAGPAETSVTFAHVAGCETTGNWRLLRRTLGLNAFGMNLVETPPGERSLCTTRPTRPGGGLLCRDGQPAVHVRKCHRPTRGTHPYRKRVGGFWPSSQQQLGELLGRVGEAEALAGGGR